MKRVVFMLIAVFMLTGCTAVPISAPPDSPAPSEVFEIDVETFTVSGIVYGIEGGVLKICDAANPATLYDFRFDYAELLGSQEDYRQIGNELEIETGPVAESYPMQGSAVSVRVTGYYKDNESLAAGAYYEVFNYLYETDPGLNGGQYLALDLDASEIPDAAKSILLAKLHYFCLQNGMTLLLDNFEGLTEKGYITDLFFEDGILIGFEDLSVSDSKLVTNAQKWRSGLGAIGAEFTAELKNDTWRLETDGMWIS